MQQVRPFNGVVGKDIFQIRLIHRRIRVADDLAVLGIISHPLAVDALPSTQRAGAAEPQNQMMSGQLVPLRIEELFIDRLGPAVRSLQLLLLLLGESVVPQIDGVGDGGNALAGISASYSL